MRPLLPRVLTLLVSLLLSACAGLPTALEQPRVKLVNLAPVAGQGMERRFALDLMITNPNAQDIVLQGMSYAVNIGGHDLFSGVAADLPPLLAYRETPVRVEVSTSMMALLGLLNDLARKGPADMQYALEAKLDVGNWLPAIRVRETGPVPFLNGAQLAKP